MKKETKRILGFIAFGVGLFALCMNLGPAIAFLGGMMELVAPVFVGLLVAFVLNVPMHGFERLLTRLFAKGKQAQPRWVTGASLLLTVLSIMLVVALAVTMVIPALTSSVKNITVLVKQKWPEWSQMLKGYGIDLSTPEEWLAALNPSAWLGGEGGGRNAAAGALSGIRRWLPGVWSTAAGTLSGVMNAAFGLVIAVYVLLGKKKLGPQLKRFLYAHLQTPIADRLVRVGGLLGETYARFLSGQCVEALLLGALIFLAFSLFGLPYALLTGFLTALCAFVPYVGALLSCAVAAFLTLLVSPQQVLVCVVVYTVVQFVENQFIYPHVVGGSVGLAPLWTLIAALIGGKLFGLMGIVFFIPLAAVAYTLVREATARKLNAKAAQQPRS